MEQLTEAAIQFAATSPTENPGKYAERFKTFETALAEYFAATDSLGLVQDSVTLSYQIKHGNTTIMLPFKIIDAERVRAQIARIDTTAIFGGEELPLKLRGEIVDLAWLPGNIDFPDHVLALFADSILSIPWPLSIKFPRIVYRFEQEPAQPKRTASPAGVLSIAAVDTSAKIIALTSNIKSAVALEHGRSRFLPVDLQPAQDRTLPSAWKIIAPRDLFFAPALKISFRSLRRLPHSPYLVMLDDTGYLNLFLDNQVLPVWQSERPWGNRLFLLSQSLIAVCDSRQSAFVVFRVDDHELKFLGQSPFFKENIGAISPIYGKREGFLVSTIMRAAGAATFSRLQFFPGQVLSWRLPVHFDLPGFRDEEAGVTFLQNERSKLDFIEGYYPCPPAVWSNVFETLYQRNEEGEAQPFLAAGLRADSSTWREWEIDLRRDIYFSDGSPLTAATVREGWKQNWLDCQENFCAMKWLWAEVQGASAFVKGGSSEVAGLEVVDEHTLRIRLDFPRPYFVEHLMQPCFSVAKWRPESKTFLGTGPFQIDEINNDRSGSLLLCRRNEYFHGGPAPLQEIKFVFYKANVAEVMLNLNATGTTIRRKKEIEFFRKIDKMAVRPIATPSLYFLALNPSARALAEIAQRRRVATALNREFLAVTVNAAECAPAPFFFSAAEASELALEENGSPSFPQALTISFRAQDDVARQIAEGLANRFAQLQIPHAAPRPLSESAFAQLRRSGNYDILVDSYWPVFESALYNLQQLLRRGYIADSSLVAALEQALPSPFSNGAAGLEQTLIAQAVLYPLLRAKNYAVLPADLAEVKLWHVRQIDFAKAWLPIRK